MEHMSSISFLLLICGVIQVQFHVSIHVSGGGARIRLTCFVGCRLTMATFPPLRLVRSGRSPLGLICKEVPSVSARSARLGADGREICHAQYSHVCACWWHFSVVPVINGNLLLCVKWLAESPMLVVTVGSEENINQVEERLKVCPRFVPLIHHSYI